VDLDADDDTIRTQADAWLARISAQGCAPTYTAPPVTQKRP
jgi:hypothetical protein